MINRLIINELVENINFFPSVAILGPRQVGKTTTALTLSTHISKPTHYVDLENKQQFQIIENDAETYLMNYKDACVIIDEVQAIPQLFTWLRPLIDAHRVSGRFVLLGSANPSLVKGVSETLAGRIAYVEMGQINFVEAQSAAIALNTHWFRGGFPEGLLAGSDRLFLLWTQNFIKSYIQRDLNFLFGIELTPRIIENLWSMLAHINASILNIENLSRSLGISGPTVSKYIDYMEGAYLVRRLPAWYINAKKRLVKSPKIYLRSTGILHSILNIFNWGSLQKHPAVGASWEAYVIEQIYQLKPVSTTMYYYRTHHGAECDIVLVEGIKPVACIEIKYSNAPVISKGFYEGINDLQTENNFVLTPSSEEYSISLKVKVCSLSTYIEKYIHTKK